MMGVQKMLRRVAGMGARALLPAWIQGELEFAWRRFEFRGRGAYCPICESHVSDFVDGSGFTRAICPVCRSKGCHRLGWLYLQRFSRIGTVRSSLLHIAPEPCLRRRLSQIPGLRYVSCDIRPGVGDVVCDARRLPFRDREFDVIYACHVINMIGDYQAALRELYRVLRPGGLAVAQVPIITDGTPSVAADDSDEDRARKFGDPRIWRIFAIADYIRDLEQAGFRAEFDERLAELPQAERDRWGLGGTGLIVGTR